MQVFGYDLSFEGKPQRTSLTSLQRGQLQRKYARERRASRLLLGVYAANHSAIGFYERCGFRKVGERQVNVGGQNYDDRIMSLDLIPST